jgi:PilZ domain
VSRRAPRYRAQLTATVTTHGGNSALLVCRTRDISNVGVALDTEASLDPGTRIGITIMDPARGIAVEMVGEVTRPLGGQSSGVGVKLLEPPEDWTALVAMKARAASSSDTSPRPKRMRVLVVGDDHRRRGALALYVTSGWDVRFASDLDGAAEALHDFTIDAVIAEHDIADPRWQPILAEAKRAQPEARRIVRGALHGPAPQSGPLVHRFVDRDAGIDALLDALTADLGGHTAA